MAMVYHPILGPYAVALAAAGCAEHAFIRHHRSHRGLGLSHAVKKTTSEKLWQFIFRWLIQIAVIRYAYLLVFPSYVHSLSTFSLLLPLCTAPFFVRLLPNALCFTIRNMSCFSSSIFVQIIHSVLVRQRIISEWEYSSLSLFFFFLVFCFCILQRVSLDWCGSRSWSTVVRWCCACAMPSSS